MSLVEIAPQEALKEFFGFDRISYQIDIRFHVRGRMHEVAVRAPALVSEIAGFDL